MNLHVKSMQATKIVRNKFSACLLTRISGEVNGNSDGVVDKQFSLPLQAPFSSGYPQKYQMTFCCHLFPHFASWPANLVALVPLMAENQIIQLMCMQRQGIGQPGSHNDMANCIVSGYKGSRGVCACSGQGALFTMTALRENYTQGRVTAQTGG